MPKITKDHGHNTDLEMLQYSKIIIPGLIKKSSMTFDPYSSPQYWVILNMLKLTCLKYIC